MPDISASLGSSLIANLLGSLDYPLILRFGTRSLGDEAQASEIEVKVGNREVSSEIDLGASENGDLILDSAIEAYVRVVAEAGALQSADGGAARLKALFAGYPVDPDVPEEEARRKLWGDIEAGSQDDFSKRFGDYLRGLEFAVQWVEVEVSASPDAGLGNPMKVQNLRLRVRAKVEGCIKVFGKKYCATVTSPWVILEGREVAIELVESDLLVRAEARASDIDIVIRIKIWKWHYDIMVGVTTIVNGFLKKQAPTVLDLAKFDLPIVALKRTYRPSAIDVPNDPSTTTINIAGAFIPTP